MKGYCEVLNIYVFIVVMHKLLVFSIGGDSKSNEFVICSVIQEFIDVHVDFRFNKILEFLVGDIENSISNLEKVIFLVLLHEHNDSVVNGVSRKIKFESCIVFGEESDEVLDTGLEVL